MHILLTDRLTCPRCGPEFGLVLLADRVEDRRILEGSLGCPNCRDQYPVRKGLGDLRPAPRSPLPEAPTGLQAREPGDVVRLAALVGVTEGPGHVLLTGSAEGFAPGLAEVLDGVELVAAGPRSRGWTESPGVSRIVMGRTIPTFSRTLRGVVLDGSAPDELLAEAARAVAPLARVVVLDPGEEAADVLEALGLTLILREEGYLVAVREGVADGGPPPGAGPPGTGPVADGSGRLPVVGS